MKNKAITLYLVGSVLACVHVTSVDEYVVLKHRLAGGDQADIVDLSKRVEDQNDTDPSLDSQIRLALVLSSPREREEQLLRARRILDNVLTFSSALSPPVRDFVDLNRREVNERILAMEKIRENKELIDALETQRAIMQHEIDSLQQDLAETNEKIKALKTIEESIDRTKKSEMP